MNSVNLLYDHVVNIILDVTSTGALEVQRDAPDTQPENISLLSNKNTMYYLSFLFY